MRKKLLATVCLISSSFMMLMISFPAMATTITVLNPGFEELTVPVPPGYAFEAPHWDVTGQAGTNKQGTEGFPGGVPEGVNVAAIGNWQGGGVISQTLTATLEPDTIYTLMVDVGNRLDFPFSSYTIEFIAGGGHISLRFIGDSRPRNLSHRHYRFQLRV